MPKPPKLVGTNVTSLMGGKLAKGDSMRLALVLAAAGVMGLVACEEKPAPAPVSTKSASDALKDAGKSMTDAAKAATDKAKETTTAAVDKAKETTTAAVDKAKDAGSAMMDTAKTEVKSLVDKAKTQMDALTKGGSTLTGEKKTDFDKTVTGLNAQWKTLSDAVTTNFKDMSADGLMKLKETGTKLMDGIKAAADKFGIKLG